VGTYVNTEAKFWSGFTPEPNTGCWLWAGSVSPCGRGKFMIGRKNWSVHRLAYTLVRGPIPEGKFVCHSCDNGGIGCGNPDHLWIGTAKENSQDAVRKGRMASGDRSGTRLHPESYAKGAKHANAKLTPEQVRDIRARSFSARGDLARLARELGTSATAISHARDGLTYREVM
jgi:hypothetical protein